MSRPGKPHVRIGDKFYDYLRFFRPPETHLLLALLCRCWRKEGQRRGLVKKESLREIARDIGMPWSVARKAFNGLQLKGFAWRKGKRLYVQCDLVATALATDFASLLRPSSWAPNDQEDCRSGPPEAHGDGRSGPPETQYIVSGGPERRSWGPRTTNNVNGVSGFTPGRSDDPMIRARVRTRARNGANAKDPREALSGRSRSDALPPSAGTLETGDNGKEGAKVSDRSGGADELEARWLPREEMQELMRKIRERVKAGEAERARNTPVQPLARTGNVYPVEEEERRDMLREQAKLLLAKEGETK